MNIVETPDGFPLWVFGVTLAVVLTTTLFLAFASPISALLTKMWSDLCAPLCDPDDRASQGSLDEMARSSILVLWAAVKSPVVLLRFAYAGLRAAVREGRMLDAPAEEALERGIQARLDKRKTEIEDAVEMQTMLYDAGTSLIRF
jgi:hypothetical protein